MRLLRNLGVVSGFTLLSRVLGFAREILTAARLGAGSVSDIYFQAFMIPNTFRRIFAEGAFNAAFVPLYARELEGEGRAEADAFAREALSALVTVTGVIVIGFQLAAPLLVGPLFLDQAADPEGRALAVLLLQIVMPYLLCMTVAALAGGALNSHGRFAAAAGAPTLLNVVLIAILVVDAPDNTALAVRLSAGVTVSGVLQAALLLWAAWSQGLRLTLRVPRVTARVRRLVGLGVPGAIAAGATQINVLVTASIAMQETAARSWINYAERLYQLPLGVIGIAMGVALLPNLARRVRAGDEAGGRFAMNRAIELSLALTLPAAAAFLAIPAFLIAGLFEWGEFTAADTRATALALTAYGAGLPAFVMVKVLSPGFFAREDTRTPMQFALVSIAVNLGLAIALYYGGLGYVGLAAATAAAGWVNALLLAVTLRRRGILPIDARLASRAPKLLAASAAMALAVWALAALAPQAAAFAAGAGIAEGAARIVWLVVVVGAGGVVYLGACALSGALRLSEFVEAMRPPPGGRKPGLDAGGET